MQDVCDGCLREKRTLGVECTSTVSKVSLHNRSYLFKENNYCGLIKKRCNLQLFFQQLFLHVFNVISRVVGLLICF